MIRRVNKRWQLGWRRATCHLQMRWHTNLAVAVRNRLTSGGADLKWYFGETGCETARQTVRQPGRYRIVICWSQWTYGPTRLSELVRTGAKTLCVTGLNLSDVLRLAPKRGMVSADGLPRANSKLQDQGHEGKQTSQAGSGPFGCYGAFLQNLVTN
jgi:hypothetical protein